jgi:hypothetical protein
MKSKELLLKHLLLNDCKGYVTSDGRLYKAIIDALEEAINYTRCCETLPCNYAEGYNDAIAKIKEEAKYIDKQ